MIIQKWMRGVAIAPFNSNLIYASSSLSYHSGGYDVNSIGFKVSNDAGQTWSDANDGLAWTHGGRMEIETGNDPHLWAWSPGTGVQHTPIPYCTSNCEENVCIDIDGNLDDWSTINPLSTDDGFTVKAADDNNTLYVSITGNIGTHYQVFFDTNDSGNEFTYFTQWAQTGLDAMVQDGWFSSYTGTGSDWSWSTATLITSSKTATGVEFKLDKSLLNASSSTIHIGFVSIDQSWAAIGFSPIGNTASTYSLSSLLTCEDIECEDIIEEITNPVIDVNRAAIQYIHTNGTVLGGIDIEYTAGNYILLENNFEVNLDASFHAYITGCQ